MIQFPGRVVDQSGSVGRPIARLDSLGSTHQHLTIPCLHVEGFQSTADEIAIGYKSLGCGNGDANVLKKCLFYYLPIVRTHEKANIDFVAQLMVIKTGRNKWLSELRQPTWCIGLPCVPVESRRPR